MSNLAYIDELGISEDLADNDTEVEANESQEESQEDFVQEPEVSTSDDTKEATEPNSELLQSLQKQIEGMEKRLADKDDYINQLREASKQKEAEQQGGTEEVAEEDFWDNPEGKIKKLEELLNKQAEQSRIQQLQIQETVYANTVENYWKTVNPDALKEAVATDADFAEEFNKSSEPYKTAYEYLKNRANAKEKETMSLREQIKQELLKEMGVKEKREVPPNINGGGKSSSSKPIQPDDGFASVFGSEY